MNAAAEKLALAKKPNAAVPPNCKGLGARRRCGRRAQCTSRGCLPCTLSGLRAAGRVGVRTQAPP